MLLRLIPAWPWATYGELCSTISANRLVWSVDLQANFLSSSQSCGIMHFLNIFLLILGDVFGVTHGFTF